MNEDLRILEIVADIKSISYGNDEKKAVMEKYGITSKKGAEIKQALYNLADTYRAEHTEYTKLDWSVWNNKWNWPASPKKIREACENEPMAWIDFAIKMTEDKRRLYNKDRRQDYYLALKNERVKAEDKSFEELYDTLTIKTFPFKEKLYKKFINAQKKQFDFLKDLTFTEEEKRDSIYRAYVHVKYLSKEFDWCVFKTHIDKEFEETFSDNIRCIAERCSWHGVEGKDITLLEIAEDPKFFEMVLKDNKNNTTIHCRSILAAEYSTKVTAHYRFLITVKK